MAAAPPGSNGVPPKSIGHYVLMRTIGEGTFGKVKLGTHILTGERVAVKVLEKERILEIADIERVAREIHILKLIRRCRHIIQLYEIIETPRQLYLIMEYAPGGELFEYIVENGRASEADACRFLHQILAGLEKVHEYRVVHRDLKPENLLLTESKDIKIVDFGLSNTHKEGQLLQTACGSPCYAAPEMIANQDYHPPMVDIWSCGVTLFALVCGYLPFENDNTTELYRKICAAEYEVPDNVSESVADLIRRMLTTDPNQRITIDQIRQHPWYAQIPEASLVEFEDGGILEESVMQQLDSFGFPRDFAAKSVLGNKHNHVTTTYYLLKERLFRETDTRGLRPNPHIAVLDACCAEDADEEDLISGTDPRWAGQMTTPRPRGSRFQAVHSARAGGGSAHNGASTARGGGAHNGASTARGGGERGPGVPKLDFSAGGDPWKAPDAAATAPGSTDAARGSRSRVEQPHCGAVPAAARDAEAARPSTARGCAPVRASSQGQPHSARAAPRQEAVGGDVRDADYRPPSRRAGSSQGRPSTARGAPRASSHGVSGGRSRLWQELEDGGRVSGSLVSSRGGGSGGGGGSSSARRRASPRPGRPGLFEVDCSPDLPAQQVVRGLLNALQAHSVNFRQMTSFMVRCQDHSLRIQAEVFKADRGAGHVLRMARVSGDIWHFQDLCRRVASYMGF